MGLAIRKASDQLQDDPDRARSGASSPLITGHDMSHCCLFVVVIGVVVAVSVV